MSEELGLTIFDAVTDKQRKEAIINLIIGHTPSEAIKQRPARGGMKVNYVNTYYMTRQISLITGYKWKSECLEERILDDEIGAKMKVTIWDSDGKEYSHESWGQKDIAKYKEAYDRQGTLLNPEKVGKPISIFDDLKAAYSDGIKKCLSYFGIANDIYGGKDLEHYSQK